MTQPQGSSAPAIQFSCWSCHQVLTVPAQMAGVTGPCPCCGQMLAAPAIPAIAESSTVSPGNGYRVPKAPAEKPAAPAARVPLRLVLLRKVPALVGRPLALVGSLVAEIVSRRLLRDLTNPDDRQSMATSIHACCLGACVIVGCFAMTVIDPPQKLNAYGLPDHRPEVIAAVRDELKARLPGKFTAADYAAADLAAGDPGVAETEIADVYSRTLRRRSQNH